MDILLMDVKTGAIPYAETLETYHIEREKREDVNLFETRKRADNRVTLKVMKIAAQKLTDFFSAHTNINSPNEIM